MIDRSELGGSARGDQLDRRRGGGLLVEPRCQASVDRHRRSPVLDDRDPRRVVGVELADDELVGSPRCREPGGGRPVDVCALVAGAIAARARDLVAFTAARAAPVAERRAGEPAPRHELEQRAAWRRSSLGGVRLADPVGTRTRCALTTRGEDALDRLGSRQLLVDEEDGIEHDAVAEHGHEQLLDVVGRGEGATVEERPRACAPLEREAASNGRSDLNEIELAGRADEGDDPPLERSSTYTSSTAATSAVISSSDTTGSSRASGWPCR